MRSARTCRPCRSASFRAVFEAVADGRRRAGVVPIENVVNGTVRENYDLLLEHDLEIRGEVVVPVRLCLAALPGQTLDEIERVYSHIQALGQAEAFLRDAAVALLTTYNTAGAGKAIVDRGERGAAAVLSPRAAALFGLEVLADDIQGDRRQPDPLPGRGGGGRRPARRASRRGRPVRRQAARRSSSRSATSRARSCAVLRVFADHDLNMRKLESPARAASGAWEYVFWVDLDADAAALATPRGPRRPRSAVTTMRPGPGQLRPRRRRVERAQVPTARSRRSQLVPDRAPAPPPEAMIHALAGRLAAWRLA